MVILNGNKRKVNLKTTVQPYINDRHINNRLNGSISMLGRLCQNYVCGKIGG